MEIEDTLSQDITHGAARIPVLPLRDVVVYPHMVIPLFVGREKSIKALEEAMETDKQIVLVAQVNASDDDPSPSDLYQVGTIATILQLLKLPDGTVKVLVEGDATREELDEIVKHANYFSPVANTMRNPIPFSISLMD